MNCKVLKYMCCTSMHVSVIIPGDLVTYKMAVLGNIFYYPSVFPTFLCAITTISEIEQNRFPYKREASRVCYLSQMSEPYTNI